MSRGRGLGGFFSSILRLFTRAAPLIKKVSATAVPIIKKASSNPTVRKIGKQAIKSALSVGADAIEGSDVKKSIRKEINNVKKKVSGSLRELSKLSENGNKKRKNVKSHHINTNRKKKLKNKDNLFP